MQYLPVSVSQSVAPLSPLLLLFSTLALAPANKPDFIRGDNAATTPSCNLSECNNFGRVPGCILCVRNL